MKGEDYGVSFWRDANILKLIVVVVAHVYEYPRNHWTIHLGR